jgi:hypothetical protein
MEEASPLASIKNSFISAVSTVKENLANRLRSASASPPAPASPPTADKPARKRSKVAAAARAAGAKATA